ncbi:glutaredoxin family protein [Photobacterium phosphoreum]|uniref:Glutaredoxin family protein n=1 Tax=Photobacterium phosphoreum TaxID=659 RepID=A0AAW4ZXU3_PHOPO|nr:glutaredoxin family protein [Photobacterium phosphoreum]KJF86936.1 glutaredoxin [Photobacterium phosphoreum]MCD9483110.1 glutaredoxin family protein [Photobacterium phosphoreum]MCD9493064.1 glutaredoxin family protein [Photobacterium phosphoreum]MCD9520810.1 glutaredoxin family protein [Photobacterium phosphoreum]MCF2192330.1 glutaredoxin family protein [Photobacterium phosphoreum]
MLITLYSTQGCHLCEQAYGLLVEMGVQHQVSIVDIAFDDALFSRYGVVIPVLSIQNHDHTILAPELHWPFDRNRLATWLTTYKLG